MSLSSTKTTPGPLALQNRLVVAPSAVAAGGGMYTDYPALDPLLKAAAVALVLTLPGQAA